MAEMDQDRPDWRTYFLDGAAWAATRADCSRRKVGAVIVKDNRVRSTGYNGSPPGGPSCLAGQCPRGRHWAKVDQEGVTYCACGNDWPCPDYAEPGSSYDTSVGRTVGSCIALHAEQNALLWADPDAIRGATIYITHAPCDACLRMLKGSPLAKAVWPEGDRWL